MNECSLRVIKQKYSNSASTKKTVLWLSTFETAGTPRVTSVDVNSNSFGEGMILPSLLFFGTLGTVCRTQFMNPKTSQKPAYDVHLKC
ncbi:conserved hypothetical protein [Ricinus communis]|uniref:Uncharacterized protein n=1 Tax=Ricinus communis TaxID=3988 RepID=B9SJK3_RICCO|nr:conserved hypothetical protein [Ricinus communis]